MFNKVDVGGGAEENTASKCCNHFGNHGSVYSAAFARHVRTHEMTRIIPVTGEESQVKFLPDSEENPASMDAAKLDAQEGFALAIAGTAGAD